MGKKTSTSPYARYSQEQLEKTYFQPGTDETKLKQIKDEMVRRERDALLDGSRYILSTQAGKASDWQKKPPAPTSWNLTRLRWVVFFFMFFLLMFLALAINYFS